ncbi:MAG: hypothetical protein EOO73_21120 [Myxococcales bacterium]|nr:MAG: hypothetical protein EOO73_21120 [Myxococcales bacterium]
MARSPLLALALAMGAGLLSACDGEFVNLGTSDAPLGEAGRPGGPPLIRVWQVAEAPLLPQMEGLLLASPSLTASGELFFSAQERGTSGGEPKPTGVWHAPPVAGGFGAPTALQLGTMTSADVASPAVSPSGRELWFGMNPTGRDTDVFRCELLDGVCGTPVEVEELNGDYDDAPRPPALGETMMALSSKRHGRPTLYQIYLVTRASAEAAWSAPSQAGLETINSAEFQSADGFLAEEGLALYFSSTRAGTSDLYVARRSSLATSFGAPQALADLNSSAEERMPWLSPDGQKLYFVSDRASGRYAQYSLYVAQKL